jgi:Flp pilus assembly protein TadG
MSWFLMPPRHERRDPHRSRGFAAVEFVLTVPVLVLLILVAVELGRAFIQYDTLSYSVRNSARFVSAHAIAGADVVNISGNVATRARNLAVFGSEADTGDPVLPGFTPGQVEVVNVGNNNIEVRATYPYQPIIGTILPTFDMRIAVTMRAIS